MSKRDYYGVTRQHRSDGESGNIVKTGITDTQAETHRVSLSCFLVQYCKSIDYLWFVLKYMFAFTDQIYTHALIVKSYKVGVDSVDIDCCMWCRWPSRGTFVLFGLMWSSVHQSMFTFCMYDCAINDKTLIYSALKSHKTMEIMNPFKIHACASYSGAISLTNGRTCISQKYLP